MEHKDQLPVVGNDADRAQRGGALSTPPGKQTCQRIYRPHHKGIALYYSISLVEILFVCFMDGNPLIEMANFGLRIINLKNLHGLLLTIFSLNKYFISERYLINIHLNW